MADEYNEDPNKNFTGFRYLMDAKTQRQYAVEFVKGEAKSPLHVFNPEKPGETLTPGEAVYALDDEQELGKESGSSFINTVVYKITPTVDENGQQQYTVNYYPVTYDATSSYGEGVDKRYVFELAPESRQPVTAGIPLRFETAPNSASLPAHHAGGKARLARTEIGKLVAQRPKPNFNKRGAPKKQMTVSEDAIYAALNQFGRNLTIEARSGRLDPVVGRSEETKQALKVLTRRKQASLCFTGEAGVGKSAMFAGVAQYLVDNEADLPENLKGALVIELDLQAMNAGAMYRGDFEKKIKPIVDGLKEREGWLKVKEIVNGREVLVERKVILAIDEIHSQLTAGKAEGGTDAGNIMKPFLVAKGIGVMGTTTLTEYRKYIEKDPALASRFEQVTLDQPNADETLEILKTLWPLVRDHNYLTEDMTSEGRKAFEEQMRYIVTMTNRYAPQESQPRKAEKALNMAASSAEFEHRSMISKEDIINAVSQMSKLAPDFLSQSDAQRFIDLKTELPKEVMGQPGIAKIPKGLIGARAGLAKPEQPWGCFVLQGPTGTGKTETCKVLARKLFGGDDAIIRLDMSEYAEKHSVSRLIGAPPGYVGFEDAEPALTERVRQKPFCILLLDEIEKAHPDVFNTLLPILEHGKMTDSHGKEVLFNNVIVVMTTNVGAERVQKLLESNGSGQINFGSADMMTPEVLEQKMAKIYDDAAKVANKGPFRPEMINRINALGGFITFRPLTEEVISKIAVREISQIGDRLGAADGANVPGATLEVSDDILKQLCKDGYDPAMGARPLQTVVREKVVNPFAEWILLHGDKVRDFVAKNGPTSVVIDSLELNEHGEFVNEPKLQPRAAAVNDNNPKAVESVSVRKKAGLQP